MKKIKEILKKITEKMFGIDSPLFIPQLVYKCKEPEEFLDVPQEFLELFKEDEHDIFSI